MINRKLGNEWEWILMMLDQGEQIKNPNLVEFTDTGVPAGDSGFYI